MIGNKAAARPQKQYEGVIFPKIPLGKPARKL
jgi:hypothetical protein